MKKAAALLLIVGLLQTIGVFVHSPFLQNLGQKLAASPYPSNWNFPKSLNRFSLRYTLESTNSKRIDQVALLESSRLSQIKGSRLRQNAYENILTAWPKLTVAAETKEIFTAATPYVFCGANSIYTELGIAVAKDSNLIRLHWEPAEKYKPPRLSSTWRVQCPN